MMSLRELFDHLQDEHGLILVESEEREIQLIIERSINSQPEEEARGVQHQKDEKKKCEHRMTPFGDIDDVGSGHYCVKCGYTI